VTVLDAIPDPVARTVVQRYFDLVNADEVAAMMALFAEEATIEPSSGGVRRGRDDIAAYYRITLAGFTEHHDEPRRVHVAQTAIVVELAFAGVAVSGAPVIFEALDLFELEEDRIRRVSLWADTAAIARQLRRGSAARADGGNA
jgi:steroid Delta-isomerase